jgi:phosphoglucosamine mutase
MPQVLLNERVGAKPALDSLPRYRAAHEDAMRDLAGAGRILVRYSGTENLVRVMVEGEDDAKIRRIANHLREVLKSEIG